MRYRLVVFWLTLLWIGTPAPVAFGWQIWTCDGDNIQWQGSPIIRASAVGFPEGDSTAIALQAVIDRWNNSPADFRFRLQFNDRNVGIDNGQNEIWFTNNPDIIDGNAATVLTEEDCSDFGFGDGDSEIEEKDIILACSSDRDCDLEPENDWYFGTNKTRMPGYGGSERAFRAIAMWALGHALGLWNEDGEYNVMGNPEHHMHSVGDNATAYPGEDASDGAIELYGVSAMPREDVSVVHWKWCARVIDDGAREICTSGDGFSVHGRTRITDNDDDELPMEIVDDVIDYRVDNGQAIQVEFTFENNGSTTQSDVEVGFYLSDDTTISLGDRRLGEISLGLSRNSVYTRSTPVTLPNDLASGSRHFIIAIIDQDNKIEEVYEDNNLTYSRGIRVN